jgi:hypothetical protein
MALSASLIATCAIAMSQAVMGPGLPEASATLKAITSQSVMGLARAEIDKAASHVMTNRKSAAAPHWIDRWIELEFMIPSEFLLIPTIIKQSSYQVVIYHLSLAC